MTKESLEKYTNNLVLNVKKLLPEATVPKYHTVQSSGFDLASAEKVLIKPLEQAVVRTGLAFNIPPNYEMQIRPRSGLAAKYNITITNSPGTIDADYLDEVKIILFNLSKDKAFYINIGDRIAQAVLTPVQQALIVEVVEFDEETKKKDRGGGFGSTGV